MTYGEFACKDLMDGVVRDRRRPPDRTSVFVAGEPVPFMGVRERDWVFKVKRGVGRVLSRPRLQFVVSGPVHAGHRFGIDDLCKPILEVVAPRAISLWAAFDVGDTTGVGVSELSPPYPPRIDRGIVVEHTPGRERHAELVQEMALVPALGGHGPVGARVTLGRVDLGDFGYGSPVRVLMDALSPVLGGTVAYPGDTRIRDLRVVRDHTRTAGAAVRLWAMD